MIAPAIAAINARIARTAVSESGLLVPFPAMTVLVAVADRAASAVRVARKFANCVAAPGVDVKPVFPESGVTVPVSVTGPGVIVGIGDEVLVIVWNGEVGVGVGVLVGVADLKILVEVGNNVRVRVAVRAGEVLVTVGVMVGVGVGVEVAGIGVTEMVPVITVVRSKLSTFKR